MGFIEDERRRHAAELEAQKRRPIVGQQKVEQTQIKASLSYGEEKANERALKAKSKQNFQQSGLAGMITELGSLGSHASVDYGNEYGDSHRVRIGMDNTSYWISVSVKTTADGAITIKGDASHSTTIPKDKWQGKKGKERLEKALKKAYKNPEVVVRSNKPDYDERAVPGSL